MRKSAPGLGPLGGRAFVRRQRPRAHAHRASGGWGGGEEVLDTGHPSSRGSRHRADVTGGDRGCRRCGQLTPGTGIMDAAHCWLINGTRRWEVNSFFKKLTNFRFSI